MDFPGASSFRSRLAKKVAIMHLSQFSTASASPCYFPTKSKAYFSVSFRLAELEIDPDAAVTVTIEVVGPAGDGEVA